MPLHPAEEIIWKRSVEQLERQAFSEPIELAARDFRVVRAARYVLGLSTGSEISEQYLDHEELQLQIGAEYMLSRNEVDTALSISEDREDRGSYGEA